VHHSVWNLLLLVPVLGTVLPWIYNRNEPELLGFPFFYWYQLAWVPIGVIFTVIVYRQTRGRR